MFKKVNDLLIYGGLNFNEYKKILPEIYEENRKQLVAFSALGMLVFTSTFLSKDLDLEYLIMSMIMLLFFTVGMTLAKRYPYLSSIAAKLFLLTFLGMGVVIAMTYSDEKTAGLLGFYGFGAMMFCLKPITVIEIFSITEIGYLILMSSRQTPELYLVNTINTLLFCIGGMIAGVIVMKNKHEKFFDDYHIKYLLERDQLTELLNRRSYEVALKDIIKKKIPVTIVMFDVNGLKRVNDEKGHQAGDELIRGAASCICKTFSQYGKVFRIGGDEFAAILDRPYKSKEFLYDEFKKCKNKWQGKLVDSLAISIGMARLEDDYQRKLKDTIKRADDLMYQNKEEYYKEHEEERRK